MCKPCLRTGVKDVTGLYRERARVRVRTIGNGTKWNKMEQNGTELKVCRSYALLRAVPRRGWLLLATRNEATTIETGPLRPVVTSKRRAKRGHTGLISSLAARSKRGQPRPNGSRNGNKGRRDESPGVHRHGVPASLARLGGTPNADRLGRKLPGEHLDGIAFHENRALP